MSNMPNITLYIPQYIEDQLKLYDNKSALVSKLLANHFVAKPGEIHDLIVKKREEMQNKRDEENKKHGEDN